MLGTLDWLLACVLIPSLCIAEKQYWRKSSRLFPGYHSSYLGVPPTPKTKWIVKPGTGRFPWPGSFRSLYRQPPVALVAASWLSREELFLTPHSVVLPSELAAACFYHWERTSFIKVQSHSSAYGVIEGFLDQSMTENRVGNKGRRDETIRTSKQDPYYEATFNCCFSGAKRRNAWASGLPQPITTN